MSRSGEPVRSPKNTSGDKRLNRLISYIHHTCEYKQYCYVGSTAKQCRLGLFQDSDFAGDLEDSKSTSGGTLCVFGSPTLVPISWMCKKQTSVSHSSTESEIISLDAGLRSDGIPALDFGDLIVLVLGNTTQNHDRTVRPVVCSSEICSNTFLAQYQSKFFHQYVQFLWKSWQILVFVVSLWPLIGLQNHSHSILTHILRTALLRFPARCCSNS